MKKYRQQTIIGEKNLKGIFLSANDFSDEKLLFSIFSDFEDFLTFNKIKGNDYPIYLNRTPGFEKESFRLTANCKMCTILASETEGVRRALIKVEELLIKGEMNHSFTIEGKPVIKTRISRCFFSPINRPPNNYAELNDDVDYYPEGFLNRLSHDGINAIWIYSDFGSLLHTEYIPEFGQGSEKRIEKLNSVIERCAKYGIGVYLFAIEPISLCSEAVKRRYGNLYPKYPQVMGNHYKDSLQEDWAFCTYTEFGEKYLAEAVKKLFTLSPGLAGLLSITQGERITSCSTAYLNEELKWENDCPHCKDRSRAEILNHTVDIITKAMNLIRPKAEFISWTYEHRLWDFDEIEEYVKDVNPQTVLMQNFEDSCRIKQLGKTRFAIDYWLSVAGPSEMFEFTAKKAKEYHKKLYAKTQVCCSHELATVPFVPVPGIVFDKIRRMKDLGVSGIMESWFFGNYPCLMSKAVEILSFEEHFERKEDFLRSLAKIYFPNDQIESVISAWKYFEKAYSNIPVNVMFSYYGPLHDGVVWELSLQPKNRALPRSWQASDVPDGDRIGECLFEGHTLKEAITLIEKAVSNWEPGKCLLENLNLDENFADNIISVVGAIAVLLKSCLNILQFYSLRNALGYQRGEPVRLLEKMEEIVRDEIRNSTEMKRLCLADPRLGYHSEAESYKFSPEKLERRIACLTSLLETEFPEVRARIARNLVPLGYYCGKENSAQRYCVCKGRETFDYVRWKALSDGKSKFRMMVDDVFLNFELVSKERTDFTICLETELMFPQTAMIFKPDGRKFVHRDCITHQSVMDEKIEKELNAWQVRAVRTRGTHLFLKISKYNARFIRFPFKIMIRTGLGGNFSEDAKEVRTLGKSLLSPGYFGWIEE